MMLSLLLGRRARSLAGLDQLAPNSRPPHVRLIHALSVASPLRILL